MATPTPPRRWQRARRWAVAGAVVAGLYAAGVYALSQLGDERERRKQLDKAKENLRMRFTELQDNSNFTVTMLLPNVASQLNAALDVEGITAALQQKSAPKQAEVANVEASTSSIGYDKLTPSEVMPAAQDAPAEAGAPIEAVEPVEVVEPAAEAPATEPTAPATETNNQLAPPNEPQEVLSSSQELSQSALGLSNVLPPIMPEEPAAPIDPRTKLELWQELKALAFTRAVSSLYLVSFLNLQTCVTLNLLGRADYITSVVDLARDRGIAGELVIEDLASAYARIPGVDQSETAETDQKFLTFSWYLLHRGWPMLVERVRTAVDEVVGGMSLKAPVSYDDLCDIFDRIRKSVDNDAEDQPQESARSALLPVATQSSPHSFSSAYLPTTLADEVHTLREGGIPEDRAVIDPRLRRLLDESRALLSSTDGQRVQRASLDVGFTRLTNALEVAFRSPAPGVGDDARFSAVGRKTARLANLLPSITRSSHAILTGFPNEYVEELKDVPELKAFAAIVFSTFD